MLALPWPQHGQRRHHHARPAHAFPTTETRFVTTVKLGKNGKMPPWGDLLSDDEIADLWAYRVEPEESMRIGWRPHRLASRGRAAREPSAMTTARAADELLKVCLDENLPPLSVHHRGKPDSGFDVALAQAIAERLGRPLKIQWFESKLDEDSSPALEANALLSDGRCSLVGGYALTKDSLVVPGVKTAKLPDFEGATRADRRRRVPLGVLAPSQPYIYSPLTVVAWPKATRSARSPHRRRRRPRRASHRHRKRDACRRDPDDVRQRAADRRHHPSGPRPGRSARRARPRRPRRDAARPAPASMPTAPPIRTPSSRPPATIIRSAPIAAMSGSPATRLCSPRSTRRSSDLQAAGTIAGLGQAAGLTYLPPREPAILGDVWLKVLGK